MQKEPGKPKEVVYSNSKIIQVIKTYWELGHEHKFITEIVARRANECIVSITEPDYKNLNKNILEVFYPVFIRSSVIWERVHDFQLGIESYQLKVNLAALIISFQELKSIKSEEDGELYGNRSPLATTKGTPRIFGPLGGDFSLLQPIMSSYSSGVGYELDMGIHSVLSYFLGISVTRDSSGLFLSQKKYAVESFERTGMVNCNPSRTPVDTKSKLGDTGVVVFDPTLYRSLSGSLQYLFFTDGLLLSFLMFSIFIHYFGFGCIIRCGLGWLSCHTPKIGQASGEIVAVGTTL
ncbi:retrovirus-related pol polyprotein from transposon TNT 1-94 [Tanacetum coccineum]